MKRLGGKMILSKTFVNPNIFLFIRKTHIICPDFVFCQFDTKDKKYIFGYYESYMRDDNITKNSNVWYSVIEKMKTDELQVWKPRYKI